MPKKRDSSESRTVSEFISALNKEFDWSLPTAKDFPPKTELRKLWNMEVNVLKRPRPDVLYEARTKQGYAVVENITGTIVITVREQSDAQTRIKHRLKLTRTTNKIKAQLHSSLRDCPRLEFAVSRASISRG